MKPKTLTLMDPLDMGLVSNLEGMLRFVAMLDVHSRESLEAADDKLQQWADQAETYPEFAFFLAAQGLVRDRLDNDTGD